MKGFGIKQQCRIAALIVCALGAVAWADLQIQDARYQITEYATYSQTGLALPKHMAFDDEGNLYIAHTYSSNVWKVAPDGAASEFLPGVPASGIAWGGGTAYGDYLYMAERTDDWNSKLLKVTKEGGVTAINSFGSPYHGPSGLSIDRVGNYGGMLYMTTGSQDRTARFDANGTLYEFSLFPGWYDGGGPGNVVFAPAGDYDGLMYMPVGFEGVNASLGGIFTLDTQGQARLFSDEVPFAMRLALDPTGAFGGDLFATGGPEQNSALRLYQVDPNGSAAVFATSDDEELWSIVFGPDGDLYVAEASGTGSVTTIYHVTPEPATLSLLALGGLALLRRRRGR